MSQKYATRETFIFIIVFNIIIPIIAMSLLHMYTNGNW